MVVPPVGFCAGTILLSLEAHMIYQRLLALSGVDENKLQRSLVVQTLRRLVLLHL